MAKDRRIPAVEYRRQFVKEILDTHGGCPEYEWLRARGINNYTIAKWDLGVVYDPLPGHERYEGWHTIPYKDAFGFRGLRFRNPKKHGEPKYLSLGDTTSHIFGVRFTDERVLYVVSGEYDCMILHQMGYKAVAIPGDDAWDDRWKWCFRMCDTVILVPDTDGREPEERGGRDFKRATKGVLFKMNLQRALRAMPCHVKVVRLPEEVKDASQLYVEDRALLRAKLEGRA